MICEWVSKNCVFFFRPCFFFFYGLWKSSEWVVGKLSLGKKKTIFGRKKKTTEKLKIAKKIPFFGFFYLFLQVEFSQSSEWRANFSWEKKNTAGKKNKTGKKKQKMPKTSEWVPCKLFRVKKNTVPLTLFSTFLSFTTRNQAQRSVVKWNFTVLHSSIFVSINLLHIAGVQHPWLCHFLKKRPLNYRARVFKSNRFYTFYAIIGIWSSTRTRTLSFTRFYINILLSDKCLKFYLLIARI